MKVTVNDLKKLYPEYWQNVEAAVLEDMRQCMPQNLVSMSKDSEQIKYCRLHRIAHNAAFMATREHHKTFIRK